jgi:site-specific recombinase XerD
MFPKDDIDGFEKYWRRRKPGKSTALHYASDVRIFFGWANGYEPEDITVHIIDWFIEWQQSLGRAPNTVRRRLISLRMFFDYYSYSYDKDLANPVIPRRHYVDCGEILPRSVADPVLDKLFESIREHQRDRAIFTLMLHCGLRVGEITRLKLDDLLMRGTELARLRIQGKGQKERIVFLSPSGAMLLAEYLSGRPTSQSPRIFLNRRGHPITITGIQLQLASYCHKADIWITCHQLRHTFASRMVEGGMAVTSVQKLLGHSSIRTTQRYIQVSDLQVEKDYQKSIQHLIEHSLPTEVS